ncbi:hypothetical protein H920_04104 [Fukomys damarensis]|uniref:Uncharacterized protein n=1 Tax=Fukomys damarensis TaxID=885580 RepID=A0A091DW46_FUKDA|nr:hypothetical protein H920_04104 [Fukomys damarensis]
MNLVLMIQLLRPSVNHGREQDFPSAAKCSKLHEENNDSSGLRGPEVIQRHRVLCTEMFIYQGSSTWLQLKFTKGWQSRVLASTKKLKIKQRVKERKEKNE